MKIKMKSRYSGPAGNHAPGEIFDVDPKEAKELISGGFAETVNVPPARPIEKAVQKNKGKETAVDPVQKEKTTEKTEQKAKSE